MAKETKAQRTARHIQGILAMLERAQDANFELRLRDGMYTLFDRDEWCQGEMVRLAPWYTSDNDDALERFSWDVVSKEEAEKEENRKFLAKQTALAKLTAEERELLKL